MYRVIVVTDPETSDGFRLAGVTVIECETQEAAQEQIRLLLDNEDTGILALNEAFFNGMDEKTRLKIDSIYRPIVIPLPVRETVETVGERRAYLSRLIHRAVGIDITLRSSQSE
ncbi:MAG: V-type ATP synthase subunit F [Methanomicrobiales archaeon HGW-Methanomicrobiales-4]|nr:MAG: V-type ATP synthase subunit F [Methanomicrobiales archaeon HGW-Methanomicrobiales-4]